MILNVSDFAVEIVSSAFDGKVLPLFHSNFE
jgi:stress-induced morphogen